MPNGKTKSVKIKENGVSDEPAEEIDRKIM
jgi:hypothetical protein